jgi:hypothetical protein
MSENKSCGCPNCGPSCNCAAQGRTPNAGECCCGATCACPPNCACPPSCNCAAAQARQSAKG